ncbi:hypothetical protein CS022_09380 [Veronia nyctiphanis]|uniref:SPOR domain-containing protein n=1 Tax=Veronia nyctiphanis TaxID=1278244 RepID=A0A4Q0YQU2_9GAMM|nr:hypothetical protein CS022_09380 [Veronia nyctiphanis]
MVVGAGSVWWFWPQSDDSQRNNALIPQGIDELTEFVEKLNQADDESSDSSASANTQPNSNQVVAQSDAANSEEVNTEASNQQTSNVTAVTTGLVGTTPNTGTKATQTGDKTVGRQTSSGTSAAKPPTSNAAGTATNSANTSTKLNVTTVGITAAGGSGVASSSVGVSGSGGSVTRQSGVNTNSGAVITTPGQDGAVGRDAVYVNADQQTEDDFELPEQLVQQGVTVGRGGDENKRIVVPDTVVDAIIDQQAAGSDGTAAVNALLPELANAVSDVTQGTSQPKMTRVGFTTELANQALLQVSEDRFALQLAALQSREAVDTFISELDLAGKVNVYETRRNGDPWFMVLLGDYASVTEARKAGLVLPDDIQALSPWAKAFTQIHQEIRRVN